MANEEPKAKKKSKELLLAEIAYADGYHFGRVNVGGDVDEAELNRGAAIALTKWKEETGWKKHRPSYIEHAC